MPDLSTVGKRLAFARSQNDWQQRELADLLGMKNTVQISQWEGDRYVPNAPRLEQLARTLGTNTGWLLTGQGEPPPRAAALRVRVESDLELLKRGDDPDSDGSLPDRFRALAENFDRDLARIGADNFELDFVKAMLNSRDTAVLWYRRDPEGLVRFDPAAARKEFVVELRALHQWVVLHMRLRGAEPKTLDDEWWLSDEFAEFEELPGGARFEADYATKADRPSTTKRKTAGE